MDAINKIYFSLAIHNHQPVGNFDWVFENAVQYAYEPMIAALERHPGVRLALHYSGPLLDWLTEKRPDVLKRIRGLVKRAQVEIMSGGYYEPVLAALPDADKLGQLKKMNDAVRKDFGYRASGVWLAERVWEPHLPKPLAEVGAEYTILDDTHFKYVGLSDDDLFGYYVTEEQGYALKVFGSSRYLRFATPWQRVAEVIDWLRSRADAGGRRVAVMGDDGEKFGLWPGSHDHCWSSCWDSGQGWVEEFFTALEANSDWLITIPPGEYVATYPAVGRVHLPTAAYEEMNTWCLPAGPEADLEALKRDLRQTGREDILRFLKGGIWRGFMAKYPEINTMHKKMLLVSDKVHRIKDRAVRTQALENLWAGQCNCPYWHGVFGGIYLLHIREATYEKLIAAETAADALSHAPAAGLTTEDTPGWVDSLVCDVEKDGRDEVVLSNEAQCLTFSPAAGGSLVEWDWRTVGVNLTNTMTRRFESYHRLLSQAAERGEVVVVGQAKDVGPLNQVERVYAKEPDLDRRLVFDWYRRVSLLDHFMPDGVSLDEFSHCRYTEWGDFINQPYNYTLFQTQTSGADGVASGGPQPAVVLSLLREGGLQQADRYRPLRLEKTITLSAGQSTLSVAYRLTNLDSELLATRFGVETHWSFSGGDGPQAYSVWPGGNLVRLSAVHSVDDVSEMGVVNERFGRVVIHTDCKAAWWQFPIETISHSEAGFERVYQATSVLTHWLLELLPGSSWETVLRFKLT